MDRNLVSEIRSNKKSSLNISELYQHRLRILSEDVNKMVDDLVDSTGRQAYNFTPCAIKEIIQRDFDVNKFIKDFDRLNTGDIDMKPYIDAFD
jgi:hypothetical protein